ncbi:glycosyltransferase family 4 protein [Hoylesella enoeca]|uniref:UDP-galactose--lipooligosaccharide galactosyltransferase n=2 Tax=Hoylesella enoeca TaxID=76123 RepID=A0A0S2KHY9_9BACT|nr:glycosyltransferase family 4 protein [Hoylesella enoeca]ALO47936.1 UDP-galactose--lipooligosaccharide galactosyltransferase [Hoylesella enoeca]
MKIFILCTRLCYGGAERVGIMLANGFAEKGHDVTLIANLFDEITYPINSRVRILNLVASNQNKVRKWGSSIRLVRKYMKRYQPDVSIGILNTCSLIAKIAAIGLNIPVVMTEHDAFERPASAPFTFWKWFVKFQLNKIYRYVTVLTEADKKNIGKRLKGVYVMPNPLSLTPTISIPPKEKIILAAGRLEDWYVKGFDTLISAWAQIAPKHRDWSLQIAGIGSEEEKAFLQNMAYNNHIEEQFQLLGFRRNLESLYQKASLFVLSSRYEGFGLVLIEAMSQGCACVACDYNGRQREIITQDIEGLVCTPDNINDLADAIRRLIENEQLRKMIQKQSIERSKYYQIGAVIARWESLLKHVVSH